MASVSLNLDPALIDRLKAQALQHGRTVDQEAADILLKNLPATKPLPEHGLGSYIHALFVEANEFDVPIVAREPHAPIEIPE
jgi:antitoxin FitA